MNHKKEGLNPLSIKKYWKNLQPPDIQHLRATKNKFYDKTFPPTLNTLYSKNNSGEFIDKVRGPEQLKDLQRDIPYINNIVWKRVTEILPKWELFEGKIEFNDVQQGSLGDCYFLSSITALCEYPYLIKEKFRTKSFNEEGYYEIIFFIDGEWQIVFVDDYFPYNTRTKNFAFALPNNNELWAILLEKAWAKLNGGYSNIIGGIVSEPVASLTGFPAEYLSHNKYDDMEIFNKIEEGDKEGTIMSSASKNDDNLERRGLIPSHAYTLISAKKWKERNIYLIKLRNPWGETEWKGKWGDNSPYWTEEYKRYFKFKKNNSDGIFWIDIDDYLNNFDATYICYILYGSIVKNFYFEYKSYFKKPVIFNMRVKERKKMSICILFKNWRFNRDINDLSHPFSIVVCKYDKNRNILKLWNSWSCKEDLSIIDFFEPGFYIIWLYLAYKEIKDPNFKYTVQVSSLANFDIEFLGLDRDFSLIQYLLLENYKKTGENNISSSKDYFIGSDKDVSKNGLSNLLLINKTGRELEITATSRKVTNVELLPPYEGLSNIDIYLPPYESIAIVGIRLTNQSLNFNYGFQISMKQIGKKEDPERWKRNNGDKYSNLLKLNIINNNPEAMGLRTGEYKYIGKELAQKMPKFDATLFVGQSILQMSMARPEKITLEKLKNQFPKEMELLLKMFPINQLEKDKMWDYIPNKGGKYVGQINTKTGNLDGKGVFIWTNGIKYIGNWREGNMHGEGILFDKNNKLIFKGNYYNNKKYGRGKFIFRNNEYYEGEFFDDKMEGKGCYYYENGDIWEGYFKNNMKNGVGIMTYHSNGDIYLYEFENDNYMGSIPLNQEEKEKVKNLQQEQRKRLLEKEKHKLNNKEIQKEDGLNNYTKNLFLQKSIMNFGVKISKGNKEVQETLEEKKHKIFLEKVELYKNKEPFMLQKFFELKPLNYEEDLNLIENENYKYLGGTIKNNNSPNSLIIHGRGVLFNKNSYYVGYWENNSPNGFFYKYNKDKIIIFQGFLCQDYSINPKYKAIAYFNNGNRYEGYFKNNKMHGYGTYYFSEGNSFTGNFTNGKFDGTGKFFYENGLITEYITYQNGNVISKSKKMREDFRDPNTYRFFNEIKNTHPGVIEHILEILPLRDVIGELYWTKKILNNGNIYIGQINSKQEFYGRCCFIYTHSPITYFVGYIINKEFTGQGFYFNYQWKKLYEGKFAHNLKNGFGILFREDGTIYSGEFINDMPNGKGVLYYPNNIRFEGHFYNGFQNDKGYLINPNKLIKQQIKYSNGNIIEQGEIYDYNRSKYKKLFKEDFEEFEKNCKKLGYEKYMNLMMNIKETKDTYMLKKGIKEEINGIYIGEMNSVGFKYGRGVFIDNYTQMYYVGYFVNNEKHGKGVNYYPNGKVKYIGEYKRDKPYGQGEFRYKNGEILQGKFNSVGEGYGVYNFNDGAYWKGSFYAWSLNGSGTYFDKNGNCLGQKSFELNTPIGQ